MKACLIGEALMSELVSGGCVRRLHELFVAANRREGLVDGPHSAGLRVSVVREKDVADVAIVVEHARHLHRGVVEAHEHISLQTHRSSSLIPPQNN